MRRIEYFVSEQYNETPLYYFLRECVGVSTRIIQSLRHTPESVFVNGSESRVVDKVMTGDKIEIFLPEKTEAPLLWETELSVIYEDEDLLIIDKPSGVSVHPTRNHPNGTLCNAVAGYLKKAGNENFVARAVGRLDKVTSGVMVFAKNAFVASKLNGNLNKTYIALAEGILKGEGTVNAPIYRPYLNKTIRAVGEQGDEAITKWKALKSLNDKTVLEVRTVTGRTHQIRVHCAHIGHALVGDEMYGARPTEYMKRAALHCYKVKIIHPITNEEKSFVAELPEDFKKELEKSGFSLDKEKCFC